MKNKIKQLIKKCWLAGCYAVHSLLQPNPSVSRVIIFHDIKDKELFRKRMQWLKENYKIVSLNELVFQKDGKNRLAITFDDGYANWFENAYPVLKDLNIPATFFVCSGLLDLTDEQQLGFVKNRLKRNQTLQLINANQIKEIAGNELFDIGGHTVNHVDLGQNNSEDFWQAEIVRDKEGLEVLIDKKIKWFAYPFGGKNNINQQLEGFLKKIGFVGAFSFILGPADKVNNFFEIPRTALNFSDPIWMWQSIINGYWDWTKK